MSFEWDMEHCICAIDDKLVTIQSLPHIESMMYDYKGHHSVHLQLKFDAHQRFIAAGRESDGEQRGPNLPNCLVGKEGFGLSTFLLRPYPKSRGLNLRQKVLDYRLPRARKIAECGFGTWGHKLEECSGLIR
ncbi:hypothetical protein QAD02_002662 [Eretmocerus hayati]|uniref:Uncharacterized protein n=1 Tax=Eretmocerus hayati TaxID=131215 RepID=A0ACC2NKS2_9HYME|nr:hypothetical protein QAD02_002662 [Eretmocerus hayati]